MNTLNATELCDHLDRRSDPVLTWLSSEGQERIELGGPVARRWIAKTDNFLASEFPWGAQRFGVLLPCHWRSVFWLLTPWLRGMTLESTENPGKLDLAVANDVGILTAMKDEGGPDTIVAQTSDSLALGWPDGLPAGILDGISDVLSYGDYIESPVSAPKDTRLVSKTIDWLAPQELSDPDVQALPITTLRGVACLGELKPYAVDHWDANLDDDEVGDCSKPEAVAGKRVLLVTDNLVLASAQLIQLWMAGSGAVWAPGASLEPGSADRQRIDQERVHLVASAL